MDFRIEKISEADFEELIPLFREFAAFEKVPHKMVNTVEQMKEEAEFFNGFILRDKAHRVLGYTIFFFAYSTWVGKSVYMDELYIRPAYQGKGLGSALIQEVISFARKNKCHKVRWQVSEWNKPAIQFYQDLGAQISSANHTCDLFI